MSEHPIPSETEAPTRTVRLAMAPLTPDREYVFKHDARTGLQWWFEKISPNIHRPVAPEMGSVLHRIADLESLLAAASHAEPTDYIRACNVVLAYHDQVTGRSCTCEFCTAARASTPETAR